MVSKKLVFLPTVSAEFVQQKSKEKNKLKFFQKGLHGIKKVVHSQPLRQ
jgi:hypothetical protein